MGHERSASVDNLLPALDEVDYTSGYEGGSAAAAPPPQGARVPPEGAPASELKQSASFLRGRDGGDKAGGKAKSASPAKAKTSSAGKKLPPPKSRVLEEVQDMMLQSFDDPADDFSNLRKLISEVRIYQ